MAGEDEKPRTSNEGTPNGPNSTELDNGPQDEAAAKLEQEKAELKDKLLRALAEMENLRRRTEKEVADTRAYAISAFARDILSVADNLRRALEAVPEEARKANGALSGLIEGVELTERELAKVLERHGVRKLDPAGEKFDPNLHQAMFEAPHDNLVKGQVHTVVQPGYAIGERVLRPALVGVSSGTPTAANDEVGE
ncbi:MAG: nucleotide exchange factor GrpE [Hyphomicrobiales bacterium]|nr:nucleotide exchange factor GrpE [Hyphomicrobiales bacterium]